MTAVTTETILAIIVSITGTTTIVGIVAICYIIGNKSGRTDGRTQSNEQDSNVEQEQKPQLNLNIIPRHNSTTVSLPSDDVVVARNGTIKSKESNSPVDTLSSSFYDGDDGNFYANDEHYPSIRRFSSSSISGDKDDDTADIMTTTNFDDNWSYAMTEEGSQIVPVSRWQLTTPCEQHLTTSKVTPKHIQKPNDPGNSSKISIIADSNTAAKMRTILDDDGRVLYQV